MGNVSIRHLLGIVIEKITSKWDLPAQKWKVSSYLDTIYSNFVSAVVKYRTLYHFFFFYMLHINSILSYECGNHFHSLLLVHKVPMNPMAYWSMCSSFLQVKRYIFLCNTYMWFDLFEWRKVNNWKYSSQHVLFLVSLVVLFETNESMVFVSALSRTARRSHFHLIFSVVCWEVHLIFLRRVFFKIWMFCFPGRLITFPSSSIFLKTISKNFLTKKLFKTVLKLSKLS